uniref:Uncharacterized protein n=1 Tax=Setaria viridis TaxID=4556 RepID=A0A4U6U828_SETVI|nr:hypothetical protein SEVIR_7G239450v2 [Setaria viridis]
MVETGTTDRDNYAPCVETTRPSNVPCLACFLRKKNKKS